MKKRGFTLMEVMVVIGIIALLVGILIPAVQMAKNAAKTGETKSSINMISGGAAMFANDFDGQYPPSSDHDGSNPAYSNFTALGFPNNTSRLSTFDSKFDSGAKLICLFLTGYPNPTSAEVRSSVTYENGYKRPDNMDENDGKSDTGFRMKQRGKVYGPYNSCEKIPMEPAINDNSPAARVFIDAWESPILYFKNTGGTPAFAYADNSGEDTSTPKLSSILSSSSGIYNNSTQPCLVISPGANEAYDNDEPDEAVSNIEE